MLKDSDLITFFKTNWNGTVITEPEMYEGNINQTSRKYPAAIFKVKDATMQPASINSTSWIITTPFEIELTGKSDADITDLVNETARLLCSRSGSGYWTNIDRTVHRDYNDRQRSIVFYGSEIKFVLTSSGV